MSHGNGRKFHVGVFETPSLSELRERSAQLEALPADLGSLTFQHTVADVRELHIQPCNIGVNEGCRFRSCAQGIHQTKQKTESWLAMSSSRLKSPSKGLPLVLRLQCSAPVTITVDVQEPFSKWLPSSTA
eukprot:7745231-Pyramimonas_sp.AAC.1